MILNKLFINFTGIALLVFLPAVSAFSQKEEIPADAKRIMWEQVNISERDVYYGPGGQQMQPDTKKLQFIGRQDGGNNLKYRLKETTGDREWVVKIADESQPEAAATRLLWAIGYRTEVNYIVPKIEIQQIGNYKNVRFEARPENVKRFDKWSWTNNPFAGTNEFEALKIMMAMFNNWDIKDENTAVLKEGDAYYYIISDLGATFGKLADESGKRGGRSVNKPGQYAQSKFIKEVRDGMIEFDYRGKADNLIKTVKVEHGRWLADLLVQLSDKQIEDAFRAANYKPEDVRLLAQAFKARIRELDEATKPAGTTAATQ